MNPSGRSIYLITGNLHKVEEFKRLLPTMNLLSLKEHPLPHEPVEDADTFIGNALIKSLTGLRHARSVGLNTLSLADDSGLSVDALDGAPGVFSARYVEGSDADRAQAVLTRLSERGALTPQERTARFSCALTLSGLTTEERALLEGSPLLQRGLQEGSLSWHVTPDQGPLSCGAQAHSLCALGLFEGYIASSPEGARGFGYDPIFCAQGHTRAVATLSEAQKDALSHRGQALALLKPALELLITP